MASKKISWPLPGYRHSFIDWRKLTKQTCIKYDVVRAGQIVAFPLHWNTVQGIKFRDFLWDKNDLMHMGIVGGYSKHFFGWNAVHTKNIVAIALGEFDALAVYQATGVPCISPPNGDGSLREAIKQDYERLSKFERIIFLPDRDKNNNASLQPSQAVAEAVKLLGEDRCFVATLSYDDPNEYLMQGKTSLLKQAFYSAQPCTADLFHSTPANLISPTQMGIVTGLEPLDKKLQGLRSEEVTYVLGAPGQGKTTLCQYLIHCLVQRGIHVCSVILEGGHRKFITKLANVFCGGNYYLQPSGVTEKVNQALNDYVITPKISSGASPEAIEKSVRAACKVHGAKVVVVDNITAAGNTDRFFESTSKLVYMFERLASELGVHFIVISHVGREGYNEPPKLGSGLGSGMIERVAHNIIGVFLKNGIARIEVLKNREIGLQGLGVFALKYDTDSCTYREISYNANEYRRAANS